MKALLWNVRGLIVDDKHYKLCNIISDLCPWFVAISETHMASIDDRFSRYMERGKRRHWICCPAIGLLGGIILSWDPVKVTRVIFMIQRHFINLSFIDVASGCESLLSAAHLPCDRQGKLEVRAALSSWYLEQNCPSRLLMGDFNATLSPLERLDCIGNTIDSDAFGEWVSLHALLDLGHSGPIFTWKHGSTLARLDRFLASTEWIDSYPLYAPSSLHLNGSDHHPILCSVAPHYSVGKRFHYDICWELKDDFRTLIDKHW